MASTEQARAAVDEVVHRLDEVDDTTRAKIPERSVALLLHDLGGGYRARLAGGRLVDVAEVDAGDQTPADVRFVMSSDQLLELLSGEPPSRLPGPPAGSGSMPGCASCSSCAASCSPAAG